ncbi:kiaa2026 [Nesidiocoris tenuis]|uniref:Kiaa2026 n=1 Tax=Nesidiocoris tenuis TaxID=355587 RepID=A0ABN7B5M1_9HEMI|nr:kiaa2026 [Nesidiocoris tenuis]
MNENSFSEEVGPRRSRRGLTTEEFQPLPEIALLEKSEQVVAEVQAAYKVFQRILRVNSIDAFKEEPKTFYFGMAAYFDVVPRDKIMWLNKIQEKLENGIYQGICEFTADLHQMLMNCYKYWDKHHRISKKGQVIERLLMRSLADENILPSSVREEIVCRFSKTDCLVCGQHENRNENGIKNAYPSDQPVVLTEQRLEHRNILLESKILKKLLTLPPTPPIEGIEDNREAVEKWRKEELDSQDGADMIPNCGELGEIGLFLRLLGEGLNLGDVTQYEVERMLLVPTAPTFLQTLFTWIFTSESKRQYLDHTPLMPYEVWNSKLRKKIDAWLKYSEDPIQGHKATGIECDFWRVIKENPLKGLSLGQLPNFYMKVWILKALADYILHSDKSVAELFAQKPDSDEELSYARSGEDMRCLRLGRDLVGWEYYAIPQFLPEIRIYKQFLPPSDPYKKKKKSSEEFEINEEALLEFRLKFSNESNSWSPSERCILVVDSFAGLEGLIENLKADLESCRKEEKSILHELIEALTEFSVRVTQEESEKRRFEGLHKLYKQCRLESAENSEKLLKAYNEYRKKPFKAETFTVSEEEVELIQNLDPLTRRKAGRLFTYGSGGLEFENEELADPFYDDILDSDWSTRGPSKAKKTKKEGNPDQQIATEKELRGAKKPNKSMLKKSTLKEVNEPKPAVIKETDQVAVNGVEKEKARDDVIFISDDEDVEVIKPDTSLIRVRDIQGLLKPSGGATLPLAPSILAESLVIPGHIGSLTVQVPPNLQNHQSTSPAPAVSPQPRKAGVPMPLPIADPNQAPVTPKKKPVPMPMPLPLDNQCCNQLTPPKTPPGRAVVLTPVRGQQTPRRCASGSPIGQISPTRIQLQSKRVTLASPHRQISPLRSHLGQSPFPPNRTALGRAVASAPRGPGTPSRTAPCPPRRGAHSPHSQRLITQPYPGTVNNFHVGARRELFQQPNQQATVEGKFCVSLNDRGEMQYSIKLPDGGIRYLTDLEKATIIRNNGGVIPSKVQMPLDGRFI